MNIGLNKKVLCEGCKEKEIGKLTDECRNEEIARFLYDSKLDREYYYNEHIRWISFNGFINVEYLAKGGFGEVYKAIWVNGYYDYHENKYKDRDIVLKRIYNSSDVKIVKEVKV